MSCIMVSPSLHEKQPYRSFVLVALIYIYCLAVTFRGFGNYKAKVSWVNQYEKGKLCRWR